MPLQTQPIYKIVTLKAESNTHFFSSRHEDIQ